MKNPSKSLIIVLFWILSLTRFSSAESWQKVVSNGFGNNKNDYAWSMTVFRDQIYVGTLNPIGRAEIWRSRSGEADTWEKVYDARFLSNVGIRYLYADGDNALYACTLHNEGAQILRSTDGVNWIQVEKKGFGSKRNRSVRCMIRFGEYLYAGVGCNSATLYRSKGGLEWELVETNPPIASTMVPMDDSKASRSVINNKMVGELAIFNGKLYAFTWTKDADAQSMYLVTSNRENRDSEKSYLPGAPGAFEVWRSSDGINWEKVVGLDDAYGNGMGFSLHDPDNIDNDIVTSIAVYEGRLYLGTGHDRGKTSIWRTSNGTEWEEVLNFYKSGEEYNYYIWRMIPFEDRLFIGTLNLGNSELPGVTGAQIWASDSGNPGSFYNLVHNGFEEEDIIITRDLSVPKNCGIRSMAILNGTLFVGTATVLSIPVPTYSRRFGKTLAGKDTGCEVWKMIP